MPDRLPNLKTRYMSQEQTLLRRVDMLLHMYPSSPCGRCVCDHELVRGGEVLSQWRHVGRWRRPSQDTELHDEVGGHEKILLDSNLQRKQRQKSVTSKLHTTFIYLFCLGLGGFFFPFPSNKFANEQANGSKAARPELWMSQSVIAAFF